jgi:SWI/SNF-related matrix-associated actin-dependent regulator 1 of chromatin subfamily A
VSQLFPYQIKGAEWLAERSERLLCDQQRVGKTPAAIRAFDRRKVRRLLWATRGAAKYSHAAAFREFQELDRPVTVIDDSRQAFGPGVNIMSHTMAAIRRDDITKAEFEGVALDEFHRCRNRKAAMTKAFFGDDCDGVDSILSSTPVFYGLSGTPAPNYCDDMWPVLRAAFPDKIPGPNGKPRSHWAFQQYYCRMHDNGFGAKVIGHKPGRVRELRASLDGDVLLRRTHAEVAPDSPPINFRTVEIEGSRLPELLELERSNVVQEVQRKLDLAVDDDQRLQILKDVDKKVEARLRRLTGLAKVEGIVDLLKEEFDAGLEKIVLFAWHRDVCQALAEGLSDFGPVILLGGVSALAKEQIRQKFNADARCRVFVGQLESAGEAIDLSAAKDILFVEADWVPGNNAQASFRCTHPTKQHSVLVRFAEIAGSKSDQQVQRVLMRKTRAAADLFN